MSGLKFIFTFKFSSIIFFVYRVISAHFNSIGKFPVSVILLKFSYKNSENMSEFSLISFVGISDFWVAFEVSKFESSFIVSFMLPDCNEKLVACFLLNFIFFKYSYVLQNFLFNAGSVSNRERFGRLIFKFAQYSPNRLFQQFQILLKLLYHFQQVFFLLWFNFSVKLRFIVFQMVLLSVTL